MALYDSQYLKQLVREKGQSRRIKLLSESTTINSTFDIFIAHSFLDKEEVEGLYIELTDQGYSVYVDWIIDPHLDRHNVTKETAAWIRARLRASRSLILAISENEQMSKWTPWELGYVDGHTTKCSILPVSAQAHGHRSFKGKEYLSLYPYIKKARIDLREDLYLVDSPNRFVLLDEWVKKNAGPRLSSVNIDSL